MTEELVGYVHGVTKEVEAQLRRLTHIVSLNETPNLHSKEMTINFNDVTETEVQPDSSFL